LASSAQPLPADSASRFQFCDKLPYLIIRFSRNSRLIDRCDFMRRPSALSCISIFVAANANRLGEKVSGDFSVDSGAAFAGGRFDGRTA
jgi:hypothetical protein